jgi:hypothetical protein
MQANKAQTDKELASLRGEVEKANHRSDAAATLFCKEKRRRKE